MSAGAPDHGFPVGGRADRGRGPGRRGAARLLRTYGAQVAPALRPGDTRVNQERKGRSECGSKMRMVGGARLPYVRRMAADERDDRWAAVLSHDADSDGRFVYAVRSTGVYCRPTCPSKRPLRRNVTFFDAPAEAEAAGFRACLRCRPQAAEHHKPSRMALAVAEACRVLEGAEDVPALAELAGRVGLSPHYLQRSFKRLVGSTPRQYAAAARLERAKHGLRNGSGVTAALYDAGYGSSRAFYEEATDALGMRPAVYGRGGEAQMIGYTTVASALGLILVAATQRGVCAVRFVAEDDDDGAAELLRKELPAAVLERDDERLRATAARVVSAVSGGADDLELPLDVRATAFQLRVWRALRAIPRGQTRSYTEVARSIGQPTAVRAVAGACATNPVAIVVPCHRVVAAGGELAGYRWGVERKRALLEAEAEGAEDQLRPEADRHLGPQVAEGAGGGRGRCVGGDR